jgi:hypothetical protein
MVERIGAALEVGESVVSQLAERGRAVPLQASAAARNIARYGLVGLGVMLPDPDWRDAAGLAGSAWDTAASTAELAATRAAGGVAFGGWALWAARLGVIGGALSTGMFGWQAWGARSRRDRLGYGMMAAGSAATTAGMLTGGAALMTLGAGTAVIPPVGLTLMAVGGALVVGGYLVRHPEWVRTGLSAGGRVLDVAWKVQTAPARAATSAGRGVLNGAKSLVESIPTPW